MLQKGCPEKAAFLLWWGGVNQTDQTDMSDPHDELIPPDFAVKE